MNKILISLMVCTMLGLTLASAVDIKFKNEDINLKANLINVRSSEYITNANLENLKLKINNKRIDMSNLETIYLRVNFGEGNNYLYIRNNYLSLRIDMDTNKVIEFWVR